VTNCSTYFFAVPKQLGVAPEHVVESGELVRDFVAD
jgi:hypothetical protein